MSNHKNEEWESIATFIVEYQTRAGQTDDAEPFKTLVTQVDAEDSASGEESEEWEGLQAEAPCSWMGSRLLGMLASSLGFGGDDTEDE